MKIRCLGALLFASLLSCPAQEQTLALPEIMEDAQVWAQENLDTNLLNSFENVDDQQAQRFFRELQKQFQGDLVINLAALRETAEAVLPLLENHEETQPYAVWLRTRLDYLQVAGELIPTNPPPKVEPGQTARPLPNPSAAQEREVWVRKISRRSWPADASNHVQRLKPVFLAQKVPPELVWIAEVESSFDPRAKSPAGAAGLFQLMPATARRFDLSLWPRDQRFQPEPSANASAKYLRFLHDRFQDWRLALAAYNAGEGTVQKLLDRYKTRSYDGIATHLPAETQMYVPKVEAVLLRREGVKLSELTQPRG